MRFFQPYVGAHYAQGLFGGRCVLIIGESHYEEEGCPPCTDETTQKVITDHIECGNVPYLSYIEGIAGGTRASRAREEFWSCVAFANFIQAPMATPATRPTKEEVKGSLEPTLQTIAELRPDVIFVFSRLAYNELPYLMPGGDAERSVKLTDGKWVWRYAQTDGHMIHAACFSHRSAHANPPVEVWQAWADRVWDIIEQDRLPT